MIYSYAATHARDKNPAILTSIALAARSFKRSYKNKHKRLRVNKHTLKKKKRTRAEGNNKFILNLSKNKLTQEEFHLLNRGTKFVPSPNSHLIRKQIVMDFYELMRKMRCKFHYFKSNENSEIHPLYLLSGHIPPRGNAALENYSTDTLFDISRLEVKSFKDNLSAEERKCM